jgi:hypothetical protein
VRVGRFSELIRCARSETLSRGFAVLREGVAFGRAEGFFADAETFEADVSGADTGEVAGATTSSSGTGTGDCVKNKIAPVTVIRQSTTINACLSPLEK